MAKTVKLCDASKDQLSNQLIKLGDMMGDGLHHEPGGAWISKEYRRVLEALHPELRQRRLAARKIKSKQIDDNIQQLMKTCKCHCGGQLEQRRSGTRICYCTVCNSRFKAVKKVK